MLSWQILRKIFGRSEPLVTHTLVCGSTRSGKSEAALSKLVQLAKKRLCALVVLDPPGTLACKLLQHLSREGFIDQTLYDRLADTDRVPKYEWLTPSNHPDPLQREAEDEEQIREFAAVLLRRRNILDTATTPLIEEGILLALRVYLRQSQPAPLAWLADLFTLGSEVRQHLIRNCTEPELVRRIERYAILSPTARRTETGPAERIFRAVLTSPSFRVRTGQPSFNLEQFLNNRGILILDGSSKGNLSRDAASVIMGAVILRVLRHCRNGAQSRVFLLLDEAVNANLLGLYESQALAEAAKWGLECHIIVQDPFRFFSEEIRSNILQNCGRHEWFRQGSPEAARLAAEDMAIPLLDPLRVHHSEQRLRNEILGFKRIPTESQTDRFNANGLLLNRTRSRSSALWPRRQVVRDHLLHYTTLQDQILLMQKALMRLRPGYRFVRNGKITKHPEYVPMLSTFGYKRHEVEDILVKMKACFRYCTPKAPVSPEIAQKNKRQGAAARLKAAEKNSTSARSKLDRH